MKVLVQKFGGTSVGNEDMRSHAINHVKLAKEEGYKVVVVVSAIGRSPEPYSTDALLNLAGFPDTQIDKREQDMLMACGEMISSVVFSNELKKEGVSATALTGAQAGFVTTADFTEAKIKTVKTARLKKELETVDVVVVAGFQGMTEDGDITTIGRGGSDTSAAALGAALNAAYIDIFTDVEGIMTADPRVVDTARILDVVTYSEITNLAYQGAKVIHPRAVEIAMQADVPIRVRSTKSLSPGTLVTASRETVRGSDITDRLITGVAHITGITQIRVESKKEPYHLHAVVFEAMAEAGISVDFINIFPDGVVYTIASYYSKKAVDVLQKLGYEPILTNDCAKVSLVGAGMTGVPGVTAKIVKALTKAGVDILQSADSHTTIWVLIHQDQLVTAVNALHQAFELDTEKI